MAQEREGQPRPGAREGERGSREGDRAPRDGERGPREGERGPGGDRGPGNFLRMLPVIAALDADMDGVISAKEIDNAVAALKTLDKNNDGKLTEEELRPNFGPGGPGGFGGGPGGRGGFGGAPGGAGGPAAGQGGRGFGNPEEMIARIMSENDKNKDGKLTGDEIPERMRAGLERIDTNKDSAIDKAELEAMMRNFGRGRPGGEGGRPPEGNREGGNRPQRPSAE